MPNEATKAATASDDTLDVQVARIKFDIEAVTMRIVLQECIAEADAAIARGDTPAQMREAIAEVAASWRAVFDAREAKIVAREAMVRSLTAAKKAC